MNVILIDHHTLVRKGFRHLLEAEGVRVVEDFATVDEALARPIEAKPSIALVDIAYRNASVGVELGKLQVALPGVPILFLTCRDERSWVQQAFFAGASGYLLKSACLGELRRALSVVRRGARYLHHEVAHQVIDGLRSRMEAPPLLLKPQDRQLLELVGQGYSNSQIAEVSYVSVGTVKNRLRKLFRTFGVRDRVQLIVKALREGVLSLELEPSRASGEASSFVQGNREKHRSIGFPSRAR